MSNEIANARSYSGVLYVGRGDQFDDDRRLVWKATSESPSENTSHKSGRTGSVDLGETVALLD
jgi:hypothetical protein